MKHYKILILAATAMTVAGCSKQDDNATTVVEELPIVELGVAKSMPVAQIKSYTATVEADNTNNIAPSQPNRIKTISVEVGDRVRRGQTLVTLDLPASTSSNLILMTLNASTTAPPSCLKSAPGRNSRSTN